MSTDKLPRRGFLGLSLGTAAAGFAGSYHIANAASAEDKPRAKVERLGVGAIGLRYQGSVDAHKANMYGDIVAVCDVDKHVRDQAQAAFGSRAKSFEQYREMLERPEVDLVVIGAPDHWHTQMVIDSCRAGKDVYCEKPLTLTIDEGKLMRDVVRETGRVVQVGSWQRSDSRFRLAVEMVRQGRLGKLQKVDVVLGKNVVGGPFPTVPVPTNINWDLWQGQTPDVPYVQQRCHYTFRWWHEYSGGQMTDWGAHHIDIAQWGIDSMPVRIQGQAKYPTENNASYNVPIDYGVKYDFANGVELTVSDTGRSGIMFTGSEGRIFVNRGTIAGKPVEELQSNPLARGDFQVYDFDNHTRPERAGKLDAIVNHMGNFFDCVESRKAPISDIESQHRSVSTCHLGNISMQLGRALNWDPQTEQFPDDNEANKLLSREQRAGFEIA